MIKEEFPVTITDAARKLGIDRQSIYIGIKRGELRSVSLNSGKGTRVFESEAIEWNEYRTKRKRNVEREVFEIKIISNNEECLNCNGAKFVYHRRSNTYLECPSCNLSKDSVVA